MYRRLYNGVMITISVILKQKKHQLTKRQPYLKCMGSYAYGQIVIKYFSKY